MEFSGDSTERGRNMWLCPGLLLLCFQDEMTPSPSEMPSPANVVLNSTAACGGRSNWSHRDCCLSLTGPGSVSGYEGGSLQVQCQYGQSYKDHSKYWCQGQYVTTCKTLIELKGNEKEKKDGRVSIRDHAENFTMTVTMENLSEDDAGSYWCKIQTCFIWDLLSRDPAVLVKVHVFPATTPMETTVPATTPTLPLVNIEKNLRISTSDVFVFQLWSLLSNIHFQVLVFLKLPLLLSMLCAVFWVNRLQEISGSYAE